MDILVLVLIFGCLLPVGFYMLTALSLDITTSYRALSKMAKHAWPNPKKFRAMYYGVQACVTLALATTFGFLFVCSLFILVLEILPRLF